MKKRMKVIRERKFPGTILFLTGFFLGCILPNLLFQKNAGQGPIFTYSLRNLARQADYINYMGKALLFEICKKRGCLYFLAVLSGFTIFGTPLAVIGMVLLGFFTSGLLTVSILQTGFYGGIVGMAMLFPQCLLYYPVAFLLLENVYYESRRIWKRRGALPEQMSAYALCILFTLSLMAAGMVVEAYLNPRILHWVLEKW